VAGQPEIAIKHIETALRLGPRAPVGTSLPIMGIPHFFSRRFDETVPRLLLAIQEDPSFQYPYRVLPGCYAHMRQLDEAREIVTRLQAITPTVIPDVGYVWKLSEPRDFVNHKLGC
jgi:hypothetical protein